MWAPDTASFGYESRAASVRIIGPPGASPSATRFEVRVPGADVTPVRFAHQADLQMNPYFAFSAIFALGLRGIANKTQLPYGPIGSPGVTRETLVKLPTSLESATNTFKREGSLAREVLGDYLVDHFAGTREHELEVFRRAVTSWEGELLWSRHMLISSGEVLRASIVDARYLIDQAGHLCIQSIFEHTQDNLRHSQ